MGIFLLSVAAVAAALVLRIMLEVRLRDRHPEVRRTLVTKPVVGNLLISHMDNTRLMGFLVRRTHKTMNDPGSRCCRMRCSSLPALSWWRWSARCSRPQARCFRRAEGPAGDAHPRFPR